MFVGTGANEALLNDPVTAAKVALDNTGKSIFRDLAAISKSVGQFQRVPGLVVGWYVNSTNL